MRARLHHLEATSTPRASTASAASRCAASPTRETRDIEAFNRVLGLDLQLPAHARRRDGVAAAAGAVVPGAPRVPRAAPPARTTSLIFFTYLYAPTVLGLRGRARARASWCRPRTTSRRSASAIYREMFDAAGGDRLQHRGRAAVPDVGVRHRGARPRRPSAAASTCRVGRRRARGRRARRRDRTRIATAPGPFAGAGAIASGEAAAAAPSRSTASRSGVLQSESAENSPRFRTAPRRRSAAGTASTARSRSTAAASIRARAARS